METNLDNFFKPLKISESPDKMDYRIAEYYLQVVEAFSRTTHQFVYIIDYYKKGFLYVSDNPLFLCGESVSEVLKMGYQFYQKHVSPKELDLLLEINEAGFDFYYNIDISDRLNYYISYDFNFIQPNKRPKIIHHKLTPLALDKDKNIWLALCLVTHSTAKESGNVIITGMGNRKSFQYNLSTKKWEVLSKIILTIKEKEILVLLSKGFSATEIADKLKVGETTIKFHKKNILNKMHVRNIAEAISYAVNNNILY